MNVRTFMSLLYVPTEWVITETGTILNSERNPVGERIVFTYDNKYQVAIVIREAYQTVTIHVLRQEVPRWQSSDMISVHITELSLTSALPHLRQIFTVVPMRYLNSGLTYEDIRPYETIGTLKVRGDARPDD